MREIKFRGKYLGNGEWKYGDLTHDGMGEPMIQMLICEPRHVIPETVGQYTGLKDRKGMEIYEGDILSIGEDAPLWQVQWGDGRWENQYEAGLYSGKVCCAKVIGNIHDNPELLKGGER